MGGHHGAGADELIRQGVPLAALDRLAEHGVDVSRLGIIKPRTLSHRRSRGEPLSAEEGDRRHSRQQAHPARRGGLR
ncbi:antitoxin Xre-like helix-turn-helix domain-containing protein [Halomonas sp.]|uniref:antitoxin Xre-like helix-turn-helix domain-containing protein n=1 Tax=Halomonas sp. TaxID=1486246 RepID=UPI003A102195